MAGRPTRGHAAPTAGEPAAESAPEGQREPAAPPQWEPAAPPQREPAPLLPAALPDDLQGRILRAQAVILQRALRGGVKVSFGEGRRATDVAMALLKGDRDAVLAMVTELEDALEFDLHVLRSTFARAGFELLLVFMEPIAEQALRSPERRNHLKSRLRHAPTDEEGLDLLDLGQEEAEINRGATDRR